MLLEAHSSLIISRTLFCSEVWFIECLRTSPNAMTLTKAYYLTTWELLKKRTMPVRNWGQVNAMLDITYTNRLTRNKVSDQAGTEDACSVDASFDRTPGKCYAVITDGDRNQRLLQFPVGLPFCISLTAYQDQATKAVAAFAVIVSVTSGSGNHLHVTVRPSTENLEHRLATPYWTSVNVIIYQS